LPIYPPPPTPPPFHKLMGEGRLLGNLLKNKNRVTLSRDVMKRGRAGVGAKTALAENLAIRLCEQV